jgi:hypothetical protein
MEGAGIARRPRTRWRLRDLDPSMGRSRDTTLDATRTEESHAQARRSNTQLLHKPSVSIKTLIVKYPFRFGQERTLPIDQEPA